MRINPEKHAFLEIPEDPRDGDYFVSAIDGPEYWLMAGPYRSHREALAAVDAVKQFCLDNDSRSHWYSWGTCRLDVGSGRVGNLNHLGLMEEVLSGA